MEESRITYRCVKVGSRLRVRVTTAGYNPTANCQFPRAIRQEGVEWWSPRSALSFSQGPGGKFFYRVKSREIRPLEDAQPHVENVYSQEECAACMDTAPELVFVPCGHHCICGGCYNGLLAGTVASARAACPMCRAEIQQAVSQDQIQT